MRSAPSPTTGLRVFDLSVIVLGLAIFLERLAIPWQPDHAVAAGCAAGLFLLGAEKRGLYRSWRGGGLAQEASHVAGAWSSALLALAVLAFATGTVDRFPRAAYLAWGVVVPAVLAAARGAVRQLLRRARASGWDRRVAAVAGGGELGMQVARTIMAETWTGLQLDGVYDDRRRPLLRQPLEADLPLRGSLDDLVLRAEAGEVDLVYLALPPRATARMKELARRLSETRASVYYVPDLADLTLLRARWLTCGAIPTISLFDRPLEDSERLVKRAEDLILGILFLAVAALPMLLIALGVKLTSRGPLIFQQHRHGLDGREIVVWKFRTMNVCQGGHDARQATRGDPRVTRFGAFLRATSLDELPQLLNVLQGRMSLVGPRPHPLPLNAQHRRIVDGYALRERIKPGITGWAQVNGYRGETDTLDKMRGRIEHDLHYINSWSIWLDLKILALTLVRGFVGQNAY